MINGKLNIQNSTVSLCNQNGINATNSELTIQNTIIMENGGNGIYITGNGHASIQMSILMANGNGILLTGSETSDVNINQNIISASRENGIQIDADSHTGITIVENTISSNNKGIFISTPTSMPITNNSISYNSVGILYDEGSHTANYNDIYGNGVGMDVALDATVDAEHNYWGDPSGPYHEWLNPGGRGNRVGGDGINIDFIAFLTKPFRIINTRPTANLVTDKVWVPPNEVVTFYATNSYDNDGCVDRYSLNFGDGSNSGWTTLSIFTHKYASNGTYYANLRVTDDYGAISPNVIATINAQDLLPLYASVELSHSTVHEGEQVSIAVYVSNGSHAVENATVAMFSVKGGEFIQPSGLTNSSGCFVTTFTAPDVTEIANVRIVARASMNGINYTDGSDYKYLEVLPFLSVQINAPSEIKSEEAAQVVVYVSSNGQPVANASLILSSDGGDIYPEIGNTDANGAFQCVFTAPQTTQAFNVTISATATKSGYMDGVGQAIVTIKPRVLAVQVSAESSVTLSEARLNVTVHVEYETLPIEGANVTITAESGHFSSTSGLTDIHGDVTFIFIAPAVNNQSSIDIIASATKDEYAGNQGQLEITVNPRTFNIQIIVPTVESEDTASVIVQVICNEDSTPVAGATVTISSTDGSFSDVTGVSDSSGQCAFVFIAPKTNIDLLITLTANATKNGYMEGGTQTTMTVTPKTAPEAGGGWPIITILLIIIPVAIAVVVIVLVKLRIIQFSLREEQ